MKLVISILFLFSFTIGLDIKTANSAPVSSIQINGDQALNLNNTNLIVIKVDGSWFCIDEETDIGKSMLAAILTAKSTGQDVLLQYDDHTPCYSGASSRKITRVTY